MPGLLLAALCFVSIFLFILAAALFIGLGRNPIDRRIENLRPEKQIVRPSKILFQQPEKTLMTSIGERVAPKNTEQKVDSKRKLANAGYYNEYAFHTYWGAKIALMMIMPCFVFALFVLSHITMIMAWLLGFFALTFGMFLPDLFLFFKTRSRHESIFHGLPDMLDLMVVCVEAGLGLDAAMVKVAEEFHISNKIISRELKITCAAIRLGQQRSEALRDLGERTGVADLKAFVSVLVQAERFGTSMAQALRVHADDMRVRRRQRAEEMAAKTTVKLIVPLVIFIFPSIFVVVGGPAIIKIFELFSK